MRVDGTSGKAWTDEYGRAESRVDALVSLLNRIPGMSVERNQLYTSIRFRHRGVGRTFEVYGPNMCLDFLMSLGKGATIYFPSFGSYGFPKFSSERGLEMVCNLRGW